MSVDETLFTAAKKILNNATLDIIDRSSLNISTLLETIAHHLCTRINIHSRIRGSDNIRTPEIQSRINGSCWRKGILMVDYLNDVLSELMLTFFGSFCKNSFLNPCSDSSESRWIVNSL